MGHMRDYSLIVIEENPVPLSASVSEGYFDVTFATMTFVLILAVIVVYLCYCCGYRARIRELMQEEAAYMGWNPVRLRITAQELEMRRAEQVMDDMQKVFETNIKKSEPSLE